MNRLIYFVVGDRRLDSGDGIHVRDLEQMKDQLMQFRRKGRWRLVISIHGSVDVIATRGVNLRNSSAKGAYDAADIAELFGDSAFKKWRTAYGPIWTTLNACQVNKPFEKVLIASLNKPNSTQKARGLGKACRPDTELVWYVDSRDRPIDKRSQWQALPKAERKAMLKAMKELNRKFGYFGSPPVEESLVLHYYFEEEPFGGWPKVTVSHKHQDTGVSFHNRTTGTNVRLLKKCFPWKMRPHRPRVPSVGN